MNIILEHERCVLLHGESAQLGEILDENSVDSIVADPPAGIGFMGKGWDSNKGGRNKWIAWLAGLLGPSFRALKPGGYALVWAIPRTSHWTATAVEDAGFEICDIHHHIFGTGFPKSLNLVKAMKAKFGEAAVEEVLAKVAGQGTALKPAVEHWILAQKPFKGTYAENVLKYGTGGINVDACRIGNGKSVPASASTVGNAVYGKGMGSLAAGTSTSGFDPNIGRWPAHLSLDEFAAALLDEQSGVLTSGKSDGFTGDVVSNPSPGNKRAMIRPGLARGDTGGASRFFYVAKGSRAEKDKGLDHLPKKSGGEATDREDGSAGLANPRAGAGRTGGARNIHPTVKSVALMKWLVKLVTPAGGVVLDPFVGSGTTGVAALAEGFSFVGCEQGGPNNEYLPILLGRICDALGIPPDVGAFSKDQ